MKREKNGKKSRITNIQGQEKGEEHKERKGIRRNKIEIMERHETTTSSITVRRGKRHRLTAMRTRPDCGDAAGCGRQNEQEEKSRWWSMEKAVKTKRFVSLSVSGRPCCEVHPLHM